VKPLLEQIWTALDNKQTVNGCTTKGAFAKSVGYSRRALEYIVYGRPEKKTKDNDANTSSHKVAMTHADASYDPQKDVKHMSFLVEFTTVNGHGIVQHRDQQVRLSVTVKGSKSRETLDATLKKMTALLKRLRLWDEETATLLKTHIEEIAAERELKPESQTAGRKTHATNPITGSAYCGKKDVALSGDAEPTCSTCAEKWKNAKTISDFKAKQKSHTKKTVDEVIKIKLTVPQMLQVQKLTMPAGAELTCTVRKTIRATQPIGTTVQASLCAKRRWTRNG